MNRKTPSQISTKKKQLSSLFLNFFLSHYSHQPKFEALKQYKTPDNLLDIGTRIVTALVVDSGLDLEIHRQIHSRFQNWEAQVDNDAKRLNKWIGSAFSIGLFVLASGLFLSTASESNVDQPKFLRHVQLNGFTKVQVNNTLLYLYLRPLSQDSNAILQDVIARETGFQVEQIKSFQHEGKNLKGDSISVAVAEVAYGAYQHQTPGSNLGMNYGSPARGLYVFFIKNFKIQSVQRVVGSHAKGLKLEFGSLQTYNPQFAEGSFHLSEQIQFN